VGHSPPERILDVKKNFRQPAPHMIPVETYSALLRTGGNGLAIPSAKL